MLKFSILSSAFGMSAASQAAPVIAQTTTPLTPIGQRRNSRPVRVWTTSSRLLRRTGILSVFVNEPRTCGVTPRLRH